MGFGRQRLTAVVIGDPARPDLVADWVEVRTRLTLAGKLLMESAPRVFLALEQARESVKAGVNGFHGQLRIALSDGITPSRLPALLARCREEDPEIEIRLFEVPLAQQLNGLRDDLYDAGFSMADEVGDGIIVEVDANDDDTTWEVDVVVGEEVKELDVTADGDITETDRESDPEDVQKAKEAEVTAQQALDTAREGRDGVTLDEMDLDDDNGTLQWEVGFDREDGSDGPEVEIDATSGEVLTVDEH